jgi:hypothetical protein
LNIDSDCNKTGCNNSSSDTGIESENEEYFSSLRMQNCYT